MTLGKKEVDAVTGNAAAEKDGPPWPAGVVLTGGTALLGGIDSVAKLIVRLPVRIGTPVGVADKGLVNSPEYATGVGLLLYGLRQRALEQEVSYDYVPAKKLLTARGIFERMKNWVDGYFQ